MVIDEWWFWLAVVVGLKLTYDYALNRQEINKKEID